MSTWVEVCPVDEIELEDVVPFEWAGAQYAVYRSEKDGFYATDGHCTHERELLCDGLVTGQVIECPKHNGRFDVTTGRALGAPVITDLRTYPVKVEAGVVHVHL